MEDDIKIKCSTTLNDKKETWQASLKSITNYENYYEASIEARSTHFNMLVGQIVIIGLLYQYKKYHVHLLLLMTYFGMKNA